ncbi:MAG: PQQ-binding-like beta-propeller repeat protein [Solirubrobacteraceae bacterium]
MRRLAFRPTSLVALLVGLAACGGQASGDQASPAPGAVAAARVPDGDWTRFDYNARRSGVGPSRTGINRSNLHTLRRRVVRLPGTVDSSPIQLHAVKVRGRRRDVVIVTTIYGRTLAIDPSSGRRLWQFVPRDIHRYEGSAQVTNATPVADPDRRFVYAATPDGFVHKLSLASGRSRWATRLTWDPTHEKLGTALNISGAFVVATTGGYNGDAPPYQGHVGLINRAGGGLRHVWNSLCSGRRHLIHPPANCPSSDSAIWARSGAVIEPRTGRILVATGNAPFNGSTDWGDSVVELSPALRPLRHWTPRNQEQLGSGDVDLGSTAPALLPGGLAVQGGKAGVLSLLPLGRLRGMHGSAGHHLGGELQNIQTPDGGGVYTAPAVWRHGRRTYVFVTTFGGTAAYVLHNRRLHVAWRTGMAGTSPVVAGGLLYVFDPGGSMNVLNPTTGHTLASLPASGGHWNSPIVIGGRIILPVGDANERRTSDQLFIYHLPRR